jgi:hypothetical protein
MRSALAARVFTGGWRDVMEPKPVAIATTAGQAPVVFSREERERHLYIVGKSGSGKSTFPFNLAMGDIPAGEGVAVIDPHGDLALDILDAIPRSRINDVCYLDVTDDERPVGLNPITRITPERRALAAAGVVSAFKHLWSDSWGPRLEHFLFHGVASILRQFDSTATAALEEPNPIQHDTQRPVMNPSCRIDLRYVKLLGVFARPWQRIGVECMGWRAAQ